MNHKEIALIGLILTTTLLFSPAVAQVDHSRNIPYLVQGLGWKTFLDVINTCPDPIGYSIKFYDSNGNPQAFQLNGGRHPEIHQEGLGNTVDTFLLEDTGLELRQGFAEITSRSNGCIAVDAIYVQRILEEGNEHELFATVPLQRMATSGSVLTFKNTGGCETYMAMAGTGGEVRIQAISNSGEDLGNLSISGLYHVALSTTGKFPDSQGQSGTLRITGEASVMGIDLCSGRLSQFRLSHLAPIGDSPNNNPSEPVQDQHFVTENFEIKLTETVPFDGSTLGYYRYGMKIRVINSSEEDRIYWVTVQFKDADGFLVKEMDFIPGETSSGVSLCALLSSCNLYVRSGRTREFLGNIDLDEGDGERVTIDQTTLRYRWRKWE